ncbi:monocarboxylate transporter 9-like isoform X1 [Scylla paramamosain]|uniref:monocarboxylate transporter 9-like isoform X1 n=3 Tax=Scylla paramamosain TaxID=85552 RepID=UPI00308379BF
MGLGGKMYIMEDETLQAAPEINVCHGSTSSPAGGDACTTNESGVGGGSSAPGGQQAAGRCFEQDGEEECAMHYSVKSRAPDGGWGWMVALGTFIFSTLVHSVPYCFGILFSGFLLENGASSTTTAWIYNLFLVLWHFSLLLANPLCQEFGMRTVGFTCVSVSSLSIILSGFAPSVYFLYFSFSLLGGLTVGMSVSIAFSVLPPYFDKNTGKANTLLVAGGPMAQVIFAPLLRYLLDLYGLQGAALIHGAIILNGLVAVSLFHPVRWHLKPWSHEAPQTQHGTLQTLMPRDKASSPAPSVTPRSTQASGASQPAPRNRSVQRLRGSLSGSLSSMASGGSEVSAGLAFLADEGEESTPGDKARGKNVLCRTLLRVGERIRTDVGVLRQCRCVILAVTITLTQTTFLNFIMMLPFVAKAAHHSLEDAARCIALLGVTNLVTRLVVSPLSDCSMFSIRLSVMLGYLLRASGIAVAVLSSELWQLMAAGVVFGLGLGFSLSMFNLAIVHYMGLDNLRPTIGIVGLAGAVGFPTLGPLIGLIRDLTSSYSVSLCVLVALDLLSVALWFLMPAAQARDARRALHVRTSREATCL